MPDDIQVSTGLGGTAYISADDASGRLLQRVKLAYSADGNATHVPADASGLLVNLGANNDVTVTSGSVAVSGTPTVSVAGTPTVSIAGGTTVFSGALSAGTAVIGKVGISANGTAVVDIKSLTSGTALATVIYDSTGSQLSFATPAAVSATPSIDAGAYSAGDNLDGAIITFSGALATTGGSNFIQQLIVQDKAGTNADMEVWFFRTTQTPPAQNAAFSITDTLAAEVVQVISTTEGTWYSYTQGSLCIVRLAPPAASWASSGTDLFAMVKLVGAPTYTSTSDIVLTIFAIKN